MARFTRRAYTLIELVIVIAILGLSAGILVPRLVDADTFSVQAAVRSLVADITFAQTDALAMQGVRRVQFLRDDDGRIHGYAILAPVDRSTYDEPFDPDTAPYLDHESMIGTQGRFIVDFDIDRRQVLLIEPRQRHRIFDQQDCRFAGRFHHVPRGADRKRPVRLAAGRLQPGTVPIAPPFVAWR